MKKNRQEEGLSNRDRKLSPRKTSASWCFACDAALVHPGAKCPRCGKRGEPRRFKK